MSSVRTSVLPSFPLAVVVAVASLAAGYSVASAQVLPSAIRWSVAVSARPAAAPVIDGTHVFVALQSGIVAAHRLSDGGEVWHVELRSDHPVAVDDGRVFIASGEEIHALNAEDAAEVWRATAGRLTAPLVAHAGWIIAASADALTAFRAADGTKVWSRSVRGQRERATIEGDNLYVPLEDGRLLAMDLRTGADRWRRWFGGAASEVLALADRVYVGSADKRFYCVDADDGEIAWHSKIGVVLRGRPAADARRVFVAGMDNVLRAFDRRSGAQRWHQGLPFRPTSGPILVGSAVVVPGSVAELRGFEAATGGPAGKITLAEPLAVPPAFVESAGSTVMAALTGSLNAQWKLSLAAPPPQ